MVMAARLLDLGDFADLALVSALTAMAVQVADLGVGIQLPQAFAGPDRGLPVVAVRQAFRRRLIGSVAVVPLLALTFLTVAGNGSLAVVGGFAISTIATAVYGAGYVALRSADSYRVEAVLEPAGRLVVLALGGYLAVSGHGLAWIAWSYALADLAVLAVVTVVVSRMGRSSAGGPPLGPVTWLIAAGPIGMIYWRADIWVLAALAATREVALYGAAYRLLDAALLPALVVSQLFPAPFARCEPGRRRALVDRWVGGAVAMMLPFAVAALAFGRPLLRLVFGEEFAGATTALRLLALAAPLTAAAFLLTTTLATLDPRAYIGVTAVAVVINVGANLLLIPSFGASGAAAVTVASQAFLVSAQWMMVRRRLPSPAPAVP
jgi:O-antigen/teichoic acid export membrane protein